MNTHPHVIIIGAGFAGLEAARSLADAQVHITLIDRNNHHLFQPLLYQVAIAGLLPSQIAQPVRTIFRRQKNLTFQMGYVTAVDFDQRYVRLNGSAIAYDFLVIAVGGRTNFFGFDALERDGYQLKDIESAVRTRNHLLSLFEQASHEGDAEKRKAMLTFVIVGGGPTGVETAGALAELIQHVMVKDYPQLDLREASVNLLEASSNLIGAFPIELRRVAQKLLEVKGVKIQLNTKLVGYDGQQIQLEGGSSIPSCTVIWTAGVKADVLADQLGVEQAAAGRIRVEQTLQLPGHPEVFVVGDAAYLVNGKGEPLPMVSPVAIQEGKAAAVNIRAMSSGQAPKPFQYRDPGLLATIGRNAAVAHIFGLSFSGWVAWLIWVGLHIYRIIGFRNRLAVMFNWAWDYVFYDNQARLITKE